MTCESDNILLDCSLITRVQHLLKYSIKLVDMGDITQVYIYNQPKFKDVGGYELRTTRPTNKSMPLNAKIEDRNIIRTKINCQRLAKCNFKIWRSFITLTYAKNMRDIDKAKIDFSYWVKNIRKVKKDFAYIMIIEFQKRGSIHFHVLSNLSCEDHNVVIPQCSNDTYFDVKYWNKGFTAFEIIEGDLQKIIGYISKYMTKECDNRLFNYRRYSGSNNLLTPKIDYLSLRDKGSRLKYLKKCDYKDLSFVSTYNDKFGDVIRFMEFVKKC